MGLSETHREAISRGQQERHARLARELPRPVMFKKRCSACPEMKTVHLHLPGLSEFPIRKRKLKDGSVSLYPAGECKDCARLRAARWRAEKKAAGELADMQREWNANRDREARRRMNRDRERERRAAAGVPVRGTWMKYRDEIGGGTNENGEALGVRKPTGRRKSETYYEVTPLREWLRPRVFNLRAVEGGVEIGAWAASGRWPDLLELEALSGIDETNLRKILGYNKSKASKMVSLTDLDRILTVYDRTDLLEELAVERMFWQAGRWVLESELVGTRSNGKV